jgi:hypothetical protein
MAMSAARRRLVQLVAVMVPVALVVFVVTRDDEPAGDEPTPREEGLLPLLGLPGPVPQRPALSVKLDATERGRPQTGLAQADVVIEELVEGGLTRLMAVYHSQDPHVVGPVRSARSTDIELLSELGRPLFAWSGANDVFTAAVESANLVDVGFDAMPDAYRRDEGRRAPYNLYADAGALRSTATSGDGDAQQPPPALFAYRAVGEPPVRHSTGVAPTTGYRTTGGELMTSLAWEWDPQSRTWSRSQDGTPHVDADGRRVTAANVLVRETPYRDSGIRDSRGAVVPEAMTVGEGDVWLLADGQAQRGRWQRPAPDAPTTYTTLDGTPLLLTPGPTWVELLPPDTGTVL